LYGIFVSIMATSATKKCQTQQRLPLDAHFGPISLGMILEPLGVILETLGVNLKPLGVIIETLGMILQTLGVILEPLPLGVILEP